MAKKSFTLIEVITVLAIMTILTSVVVVSISSLSGLKLEAEAKKLVSDIAWARQLAMSEHSIYALNFQGAHTYNIYSTPNGRPSDFTPANLMKQVVLESSLTLLAANLWIYSPNPADSLGYCYGINDISVNNGALSKNIKIFNRTCYVEMQ
ncbi:MAG: prepilin-type N-terminal cleavage/methylation domain-containing protein [Candidatus Omnitrophota bacterium]